MPVSNPLSFILDPLALVTTLATDGDDIVQAFGSDIAGGSFDGGGGTDTLQLNGGGEFDLTKTAIFQNFEIIRGSEDDDRITLGQHQLSGLGAIDGGVTSDPFGHGWNFLHLIGSTFDLRSIAIANITGVVIETDNAAITVDEHSTAMAVRGTYAQNDHLILDGVTLSAAEIADLHGSGVDRISMLDGTLISVDHAPVVANLAGNRTTISKGGTVFVDAGGDAVLSDDGGLISYLYVSIANSYWDGEIELARTGRVSFSVGDSGSVFVDSTEVGAFERYGDELSIDFNGTGTSERVSEVMRAITYTDKSSSTNGYTEAKTTKIEVSVGDADFRRTIATVEIQLDAVGTPPAVRDPTDYADFYPRRDLVGTRAADTLTGGSGHDTLSGKLGKDVLTGGGGRDMFVFDTKPGKKNIDKIIDFNPTDDTIGLENAVFKGLGKKIGVLKKSAFWKGAKAHDASDRILHDKKAKALLYDPDGTGSKAAVKFATIKKVGLTYEDFLLL